jgi:hypothetical protein
MQTTATGDLTVRKRKFPTRWLKQWWIIELYSPVGLFKRKTFFVFATTHNTAQRKLLKRYPEAQPLCISCAA